MVRALLFMLLIFFVSRAVWRLFDGIVEGASRPRSRQGHSAPEQGVAMVRDPVCGTFIVPESALSLTAGGRTEYFCSEACRTRYRDRS